MMKLEKLYSIIEKKFHSFALTEQITIIFAAKNNFNLKKKKNAELY